MEESFPTRCLPRSALATAACLPAIYGPARDYEPAGLFLIQYCTIKAHKHHKHATALQVNNKKTIQTSDNFNRSSYCYASVKKRKTLLTPNPLFNIELLPIVNKITSIN